MKFNKRNIIITIFILFVLIFVFLLIIKNYNQTNIINAQDMKVSTKEEIKQKGLHYIGKLNRTRNPGELVLMPINNYQIMVVGGDYIFQSDKNKNYFSELINLSNCNIIPFINTMDNFYISAVKHNDKILFITNNGIEEYKENKINYTKNFEHNIHKIIKYNVNDIFIIFDREHIIQTIMGNKIEPFNELAIYNLKDNKIVFNFSFPNNNLYNREYFLFNNNIYFYSNYILGTNKQDIPFGKSYVYNTSINKFIEDSDLNKFSEFRVVPIDENNVLFFKYEYKSKFNLFSKFNAIYGKNIKFPYYKYNNYNIKAYIYNMETNKILKYIEYKDKISYFDTDIKTYYINLNDKILLIENGVVQHIFDKKIMNIDKSTHIYNFKSRYLNYSKVNDTSIIITDGIKIWLYND